MVSLWRIGLFVRGVVGTWWAHGWPIGRACFHNFTLFPTRSGGNIFNSKLVPCMTGGRVPTKPDCRTEFPLCNQTEPGFRKGFPLDHQPDSSYREGSLWTINLIQATEKGSLWTINLIQATEKGSLWTINLIKLQRRVPFGPST
jgi:hypothetical protein